MKLLLFIAVGAVLAFLILAIVFNHLMTRTPSDLKRLTKLLSGEWQLLSWNHQPMGWLGQFEAQGRRFDVSSHRGDVMIVELIGADRHTVGLDGPKSPEQVREFLAKAVA